MTHLRIGLDHLAAIGIGLDYDPAGELEGILADLRLIVSGRASIADLRPEVPNYMVRAAIAIPPLRAEPGTDAMRALRGALKVLLRRFGLRAVAIDEHWRPPETGEPPPTDRGRLA